jgi:hypothetical protein
MTLYIVYFSVKKMFQIFYFSFKGGKGEKKNCFRISVYMLNHDVRNIQNYFLVCLISKSDYTYCDNFSFID